jgi:ankyrin repeat protein
MISCSKIVSLYMIVLVHMGNHGLGVSQNNGIGVSQNNEKKYQRYAMVRAAAKGRVLDVENYLNDGKVDVDRKGEDGCNNCLHRACQNGHIDVVKLLLDHGANIELKTRFKQTPLFIACQYGHHSIVALLLDRGASIDLCIDNSRSRSNPLHETCSNGHENIVRLLLEHGADPNARSPSWLSTGGGNTPLHVACENDREECVEELLRFGADVDRKNEEGETPLDVAKELGNNEIVELLLEHNKALTEEAGAGQEVTNRTSGDDDHGDFENQISNMETALALCLKQIREHKAVAREKGEELNGTLKTLSNKLTVATDKRIDVNEKAMQNLRNQLSIIEKEWKSAGDQHTRAKVLKNIQQSMQNVNHHIRVSNKSDLKSKVQGMIRRWLP